jgi:hypothetical protein
MEPTELQLQLEAALGEYRERHQRELYEKALVSARAVCDKERVTPPDFSLVVQLYAMGHLVREWCGRFARDELPGSCRAGLAMLFMYAEAGNEGWINYILPYVGVFLGVLEEQFYSADLQPHPVLMTFISHIASAPPVTQ